MNRILVIAGLIIALALVLTSACAPGEPPAPTPAPEEQFNAQAEEQAIRDHIATRVAAFNNGDVEAWAAGVAVDYKGVNQYGAAVNGRAEVQKNSAETLATVAGSPPKLAVTVESITFVKPDVAVVPSTWEVTGLPPETPGTRGRTMNVRIEQGAEWLRAAEQLMVPLMPPTQP